jgi:hypothetical protein
MSSADEVRFRLQSSNSEPRLIKVIALDIPSEEALRRLAKRSWNQATFLSASTFEVKLGNESGGSREAWLTDLAGHSKSLKEEVDAADLIIMVVAAGGNAQAAKVIGSECSLRRVNTASFMFGTISVSDGAISKTLVQLRPWSLMVVIADASDYIEDMLVALRA